MCVNNLKRNNSIYAKVGARGLEPDEYKISKAKYDEIMVFTPTPGIGVNFVFVNPERVKTVFFRTLSLKYTKSTKRAFILPAFSYTQKVARASRPSLSRSIFSTILDFNWTICILSFKMTNFNLRRSYFLTV